MIYFWSDTHFQHNKDFIYESRGFNSIAEHDAALFNSICNTVKPDDDLYLLGDVCLGDNTTGISYLQSIPCNVHIILGNHDTKTREQIYRECSNVVEVEYSTVIKYKKWSFYLSHYPSIVGNFNDKTRPMIKQRWNLHGHTHSSDPFQFIQYNAYNVAVDAHLAPVSIDYIIDSIKYVKEHYSKNVYSNLCKADFDNLNDMIV